MGLQAVFSSVFPIKDSHETTSLEFVQYEIGDPKYSEEECIVRGLTFASPMKVTIRLVVFNVDPNTKIKDIKAVKEQDVYFGEIPLMTERGTFIINGTERVIVSQLHRSPGVYFDCDQSKAPFSGNFAYTARIIPYRGSWLDFEFDHKELLYVRIDKRKKIPVTLLLRALGYSEKEILDYFYEKETVIIKDGKVFKETPFDLLARPEGAGRHRQHGDGRGAGQEAQEDHQGRHKEDGAGEYRQDTRGRAGRRRQGGGGEHHRPGDQGSRSSRSTRRSPRTTWRR